MKMIFPVSPTILVVEQRGCGANFVCLPYLDLEGILNLTSNYMADIQ